MRTGKSDALLPGSTSNPPSLTSKLRKEKVDLFDCITKFAARQRSPAKVTLRSSTHLQRHLSVTRSTIFVIDGIIGCKLSKWQRGDFN